MNFKPCMLLEFLRNWFQVLTLAVVADVLFLFVCCLVFKNLIVYRKNSLVNDIKLIVPFYPQRCVLFTLCTKNKMK